MMSPGEVLRRVNDLLVPDIPPQMFVTCLYGILDPETGHFDYANAGHNLPYVNKAEGVIELRATGMPLGLMEGMSYEEKEAELGYGEVVLLYSDGIDEAHDPTGDMFGFPRLMGAVKAAGQSDDVIDSLLSELSRFTGTDWEQEDDITLVTFRRTSGAESAFTEQKTDMSELGTEGAVDEIVVDEFSLPSEEGNERVAIDRLTDSVAKLGIESPRLERLKTAVGEAVMNAIEHGNANDPLIPVEVRIVSTDATLSVSITDRGPGAEIPEAEAEVPDLEAKLAGEQTARGWGLFLIKNMVDDLTVNSDGDHHTVTLTIYQKGAADERESV
jgi:anti-sigma regulatory factor (Ser/Thr protein kinase)